jgi:hypothetical protein
LPAGFLNGQQEPLVFHHRRVRGEGSYGQLRFLARWPSGEAMKRARDRIREITAPRRLLLGVAVIVQDSQPVPARLGELFPLRQ